ncbi:putative ATP-grasp-modified RiPP [Streptomyces europaeiscabiei]|uniref:putative ATP-grasp-modified RiPP n=1 Tax=Streptomyces europaeiscabiei TaxID=146819 RepID=UPI0029AD6E51|nr:putative ATP-grasp-modified RiPP [Streptomyces europaeiscabiei]MDX3613684.1 putative ATP-grasp-modified RiPP [Streptomyces europaeiscabiei]
MPTATLVPFGARAERTPYTVTLEAGSFTYDPARQVNVLTDGSGTLWSRSTSLAGSCTNTNWDSKNDDTADPYLMR